MVSAAKTARNAETLVPEQPDVTESNPATIDRAEQMNWHRVRLDAESSHGRHMHGATDFIAELVRAANRVERLPDATRACLLDISYETIRDMREEIGLPSVGYGQDIAIDMMTMARAIPVFSDAEVASALLEAAAEIRSLHIAGCEQRSSPGMAAFNRGHATAFKGRAHMPPLPPA
ncbi:hypothetical protein J2T09_004837 [Neorhizobium huautlense]|uniref:Uncharacterized protein n=1 Tax=Neorhizobium huautlense TaxID=67774 RepID=A0ABT9Q006_9HYPH|nr:hypothetical protein [Neorhizobium huautlense]MDP9840057.1 hypothetical protein [Neorhizobium huautlense]